MKRIHYVSVSFYRIVRGGIHILRPARSSDYYDRLRLYGPDCGYDSFRIGLHFRPCIVGLGLIVLVCRLIPYLINHIRDSLVSGRHVCEELNGLFRMKLVGMPIYKNIHSVLNCRIHDGFSAFFSEIRVIKIACGLGFRGTKLDSYSSSDCFRSPFVHDMGHRLTVIEPWP